MFEGYFIISKVILYVNINILMLLSEYHSIKDFLYCDLMLSQGLLWRTNTNKLFRLTFQCCAGQKPSITLSKIHLRMGKKTFWRNCRFHFFKKFSRSRRFFWEKMVNEILAIKTFTTSAIIDKRWGVKASKSKGSKLWV